MKDLYSDLGVSTVLVPATRTADATSSAIDLYGYESVILAASFGQSGDTLSGSVYVEAEVQESDDNSTYTAVANANLHKYVTGTNVGTFAVVDGAADDEQVYITGYKGTKRYLKVVLNFTGTHTNGIPCEVYAIKGDAHKLPVNTTT